jgi:hypothetical protein
MAMSMPLQGIRIIDLSQALAGPFEMRTLADLAGRRAGTQGVAQRGSGRRGSGVLGFGVSKSMMLPAARRDTIVHHAGR